MRSIIKSLFFVENVITRILIFKLQSNFLSEIREVWSRRPKFMTFYIWIAKNDGMKKTLWMFVNYAWI